MASLLSIVIASEVSVAKTEWKETQGKIESVELNFSPVAKSTVVFTYKVDGSWYSGTFTNYAYPAPQVGDPLVVRYDATNPERNDVVEKPQRAKWIVAGICFFVWLVWMCFHFS